MIYAVIIDDEPIALTVLDRFLAGNSEIEVMGKFTNPTVALEQISELPCDVVFLDIDMPGIDGLSFAEKIRDFENPPYIVFTTAYSTYMLDALRVHAFDFLQKPIEQDVLNECIHRLQVAIAKDVKKHHFLGSSVLDMPLKIAYRSGFYVFRPNDLLAVLADGSYSTLILNYDKLTLPWHLGKVEKLLPSKYFLRIGRSSLINPKYFRSLDKKRYIVVLGVGERKIEVAISGGYVSVIEQFFDQN